MNSSTSNGAAIAASGIAAGIAMAEAEKARQRRQNNMGRDQLLISTKMRPKEVGEAIHKLWGNFVYKDEGNGEGKLYQKPGIPFHFIIFITFTAIAAFIQYILWSHYIDSYNNYHFNDEWREAPYSDSTGWMIAIAFGAIIGYLVGREDTEIEYIRICGVVTETVVLIKIYDSDGYRNIDEDEILQLITAINGKHKELMEM